MCGTTTTKATTTPTNVGASSSTTTTTTTKEEDEDIIPTLLQPLIIIYRFVAPKINIPIIGILSNFNFGFSILCAIVLGCIRQLFIWPLLMSKWGSCWPIYSKMTTDAASSLTSIIHSCILVFYLGICLYKIPCCGYIPSATMSSYPKWYQDSTSVLLEFCTGYMIFDSFFLIYDTIYYLKMDYLSEFDMLVLAHHILTSCYMISTKLINAGQLSAMILMFTGEITNPLMNGMLTTRFAIQLDCDSTNEFILQLHTFLEYSFAITYCIFRIVIGPLCSLHLTYDLIFTKHGRENVPLYISLIWVSMVWAVIYGSIPFVIECIEMIYNGYGQLKYNQNYDYGERYQIRSFSDEL